MLNMPLKLFGKNVFGLSSGFGSSYGFIIRNQPASEGSVKNQNSIRQPTIDLQTNFDIQIKKNIAHNKRVNFLDA